MKPGARLSEGDLLQAALDGRSVTRRGHVIAWASAAVAVVVTALSIWAMVPGGLWTALGDWNPLGWRIVDGRADLGNRATGPLLFAAHLLLAVVPLLFAIRLAWLRSDALDQSLRGRLADYDRWFAEAPSYVVEVRDGQDSVDVRLRRGAYVLVQQRDLPDEAEDHVGALSLLAEELETEAVEARERARARETEERAARISAAELTEKDLRAAWTVGGRSSLLRGRRADGQGPWRAPDLTRFTEGIPSSEPERSVLLVDPGHSRPLVGGRRDDAARPTVTS